MDSKGVDVQTRKLEQQNSSGFRKLMNRVNPLMRWLLRSPLHRLFSESYVLITVTGRKTGREYVAPVSYAQDGSTLWLLTTASYLWWRNLRGGADVRLRLRGKDVRGWAVPDEDEVTAREALRRIYPRIKPEQIGAMASGRVAIRVELASS
jgi:hypothetical protein